MPKGYEPVRRVGSRDLGIWRIPLIVFFTPVVSLVVLLVEALDGARSLDLVLPGLLIFVGLLATAASVLCYVVPGRMILCRSRPRIRLPAYRPISDAADGERVLVEGRIAPLGGKTVRGRAGGRVGVLAVVDVSVYETSSKHASQWHSVHQEERGEPFLLDDGSGMTLMLRPEDADVDVERNPRTIVREFSPSDDGLPDEVLDLLQEDAYVKRRVEGGRYARIYETVLREGDPMVVVGRLKPAVPSPYRGRSGTHRELERAELIFGGSREDLRRWLDDERLLGALALVFCGFGVLMFMVGLSITL